ncbi:DUF2463 domain-containing protein [Encephalitozoon hellem]|uniref:DUF2463 domain-containing protein n=1 Tax=Encephalitozoon hellem TaxID=27973 RepID=A0A9Q9C9D3_ENCHE|nr:DUF2463 domain-containing protein [Encephalitozoon hellem]UTX42859.1 DUF2463 domain-containing protein [Encephalitozoon hellem]
MYNYPFFVLFTLFPPTMNVNINVSQLDLTDKHTKERKVKLDCWDIIQICAAPISIVLPIITYLLLEEDTIRYNTLPHLAIVLPPFLYSGIQYFVLFNNNRKEECESLSTLKSALAFLLNTLLLLFSIISFLSIIALLIDKWDKDSEIFFSIVLPPLLAPTYLLSTSCSLAQSNFHYTTANTVDILLDLLILLSIPAPFIACIVFNIGKNAWMLCFTVILAILTLIRSWKEKYFPSAKYDSPTRLWRVAIPVIILVIAIIAYGFMAILSLLILHNELPSLFES